MKNMGSILMHVDSLHIPAVYIARNMRSPVNHKNSLSGRLRFMRKNTPEKPCSYNQIVIIHFFCSLSG